MGNKIGSFVTNANDSLDDNIVKEALTENTVLLQESESIQQTFSYCQKIENSNCDPPDPEMDNNASGTNEESKKMTDEDIDTITKLKGREEELGKTIQYLAEENVSLKTANSSLEKELDELKRMSEELRSKQNVPDTLTERNTPVNEKDYFPESAEQKIKRLESNLESERQEKWSAIEKGERTRVDLVNCERLVAEKDKIIESLQCEIRSNKSQIEVLSRSVLDNSSASGETSNLDNVKELTECYKNQDSLMEVHKSTNDLEVFRADLSKKREARQKALAAISTELHELRTELDQEKNLRHRLEIELRNRKAYSESEKGPEDTDWETLKVENENLKIDLNNLEKEYEKVEKYKDENQSLLKEAQSLKEDISDLKTDIRRLKHDLGKEKRKNERMLNEKMDLEKENERYRTAKSELESEREQMWEDYDKEKLEISKRTKALKEVIDITRQMLVIRESQVEQLKSKLKDIEENIASRIGKEQDNLREEYEKQLNNIKTLKALYEERVNLIQAEKQKLIEQMKENTNKIEEQNKKIEEVEKEMDNIKTELENEKTEKQNLQTELKMAVAQAKDCENEITLINNLFTQMLLGPYNSGNGDLDRLTELLQENHDLLTDMTSREESSEIASVLPKLLLDLVTQVDSKVDEGGGEIVMVETTTPSSISIIKSDETEEGVTPDEVNENQEAILPILSYKNATEFDSPPGNTTQAPDNKEEEKEEAISNSPHETVEEKQQEEPVKALEHLDPTVQEIASNLPKVWKVLMELLSHHVAPEEHNAGDEKQCYKNIETPYGTRSVISVSKTFIRLKDLILEKKSLQKALTRLKQLNIHLESRLEDQERRLSQVQSELHKTWGIVGRMRAQHQQLHNHEKILRYELQEKRIMLSELKQELEYCKEKWESARQKNNESETEWKKLRKEFAARKNKAFNDSDLNDSGESGYSDEPNESGEDDEKEMDSSDRERSLTQSPVIEEKTYQLDVNTSTFHLTQPTTIEVSMSQNGDVVVQCSLNSQSREVTSQEASEIPAASHSEEQNEVTTDEQIHTETADSELPGNSQNNNNSHGAIPKVKCQSSNNTVSSDHQDDATDSRAARLKRLEEQCQLLVRKVNKTTNKSNLLSNRLELLHEHYGTDEQGSEENIDLRNEDNISEESNTDNSQTTAECSQGNDKASHDDPDEANERLSECNSIENPMFGAENTDASFPPLPNHSLLNNAEECQLFDNSRSQQQEGNENECIRDDLEHLTAGATNNSNAETLNTPTASDSRNVSILQDKLEEVEERNERLRKLQERCRTLVQDSVKPIQCSVVSDSDSTEPSTSQESTADCASCQAVEMNENKNNVSEEARRCESVKKRSAEEILEARAARLKRLEEQCKALTNKVTNTAQRSNYISNRLDEIHEQYASDDSSIRSDRISRESSITDSSEISLRIEDNTVTQSEHSEVHSVGENNSILEAVEPNQNMENEEESIDSNQRQ